MIMKSRKGPNILALIWLIGFCLLIPVKSHANETARNFIEATKDYKEEKFDAAIAKFQKIAESGVENSVLYYNLGNAYLKKGDIGHAMLWYERALKLNPNDPELRFNYKYALSKVEDQKEEKDDFPILEILFFWKYMLSPKTIQWTAVILNAILWLTMMLRLVFRKRSYKIVVQLIMIITLVFTLTAFYNYYESKYLKEAVILSPELSVRSGLADDSTQLFVLHAGTKVKIEKERDGYYRIFFSEGKIGWIKKADASII